MRYFERLVRERIVKTSLSGSNRWKPLPMAVRGFTKCWNGRRGRVEWAPRSSNSSLLDFFFEV